MLFVFDGRRQAQLAVADEDRAGHTPFDWRQKIDFAGAQREGGGVALDDEIINGRILTIEVLRFALLTKLPIDRVLVRLQRASLHFDRPRFDRRDFKPRVRHDALAFLDNDPLASHFFEACGADDDSICARR